METTMAVDEEEEQTEAAMAGRCRGGIYINRSRMRRRIRMSERLRRSLGSAREGDWFDRRACILDGRDWQYATGELYLSPFNSHL
jgi:hypothetical protein